MEFIFQHLGTINIFALVLFFTGSIVLARLNLREPDKATRRRWNSLSKALLFAARCCAISIVFPLLVTLLWFIPKLCMELLTSYRPNNIDQILYFITTYGSFFITAYGILKVFIATESLFFHEQEYLTEKQERAKRNKELYPDR